MLKVKFLRDGAVMPTVAHPGEDLGYDLYASDDATLYPGVVTKVPTAISAVFELTYGTNYSPKYGLLLRDRSSMASKGIMVSAGVVDAGYRGEIVVLLTNMTQDGSWYQIKKGDKIAQMIPLPVLTDGGAVQVDELPQSQRGTAGFGSTGT